MTEKLIPAKDAAEMVGVSYQTIRLWISKNTVEYTRRGGRNFFTQDQLDKIVVRVPKGGAA